MKWSSKSFSNCWTTISSSSPSISNFTSEPAGIANIAFRLTSDINYHTGRTGVNAQFVGNSKYLSNHQSNPLEEIYVNIKAILKDDSEQAVSGMHRLDKIVMQLSVV